MAHLTVRGPCVWIVVLCSPAFGELSGYQFAHTFMGSKEDRKAMWGDAPIEVTTVKGLRDLVPASVMGDHSEGVQGPGSNTCGTAPYP